MDIQQRPPEYGHRWHHARNETENGCVSSTVAPRQKREDYHLAENILRPHFPIFRKAYHLFYTHGLQTDKFCCRLGLESDIF